MEIRLSGHGSYHHQFHIVWIPKYRKRIIKGELKEFIKKHIVVIQEHHPDVEIQEYSFQEDHIHLVMIIPPKYSVSEIVGKMKANTSREIRKRFPWVKELYTKNEFWSPGFFSSTVGIDEKVIKRYVQYQEKVDKGQLQLKFDFGI
jgi:putative transposase